MRPWGATRARRTLRPSDGACAVLVLSSTGASLYPGRTRTFPASSSGQTNAGRSLHLAGCLFPLHGIHPAPPVRFQAFSSVRPRCSPPGSPGDIQSAAPAQGKRPSPLPRPTTTHRLHGILQAQPSGEFLSIDFIESIRIKRTFARPDSSVQVLSGCPGSHPAFRSKSPPTT